MTSAPASDPPDLIALAVEVCDLWQEHLTRSTQDPEAKAAMMRLIEPQRQMFATMFADYGAMMQNVRHAGTTPATTTDSVATSDDAPGPAPAAAASHDISLRLAQLAHRVAQLERHCAELEKRLGQSERRSYTGTTKATGSPETD